LPRDALNLKVRERAAGGGVEDRNAEYPHAQQEREKEPRQSFAEPAATLYNGRGLGYTVFLHRGVL
jgi:hypothetical protein